IGGFLISVTSGALQASLHRGVVVSDLSIEHDIVINTVTKTHTVDIELGISIDGVFTYNEGVIGGSIHVLTWQNNISGHGVEGTGINPKRGAQRVLGTEVVVVLINFGGLHISIAKNAHALGQGLPGLGLN